MTTGFDLTEAAVSFNADTEVNWNSFPLPIPENVLTFATDTLKFKIGDGIHHYHDLTNIVTLAEISAYHQEALNTLVSLPLMSSNHIITINNELFTASSTSLVDITNRIDAIIDNNNIQTAKLAAVNSQFNSVNSSISGNDDRKLVTVGNHQMQPGILSDLITPIAKYVSPISIIGVSVYSDQACTVPIDEFYPNSIYYVKVDASHNTVATTLLTFELSSNSLYTNIETLGYGLFRIRVSESPVNNTVVFTAAVSYDIDSVVNVLDVSLLGYIEQPIFANSIGVFNDIDCTTTATQFAADTSYYAKINASFGNIDISTINFNLSISNQYVMTTDLGLGLFKIDVAEPDKDYALTLNASVSHGTYNVGCSIEVLAMEYIPEIQFDSIGVYSDIECLIPVALFSADTTYYAKVKVIAPKTPVNLITFTLTDNNQYTTITHIGDDIFKIDVAEPLVDVVTTLSANASYKSTSVGGIKAVSLLQYIPPIVVTSIGVFSDSGCTTEVTEFAADTSYYAKVNTTYGNLNISQVAFTLTDNNTYTSISHVSNNIFKIEVTEPPVDSSTTLIGTASYSTASANLARTVTLLQYVPVIVISSVDIFSDAGCSLGVTQFAADTTYYAKINATFGNLTIDQITFALFDSNQYLTISHVSNNVFKIDVGEPLSTGSTVITGTASYSTASDNDTKTVTLLQYVPSISVTSIGVFSDTDCTIGATSFAADTSYYAKINASFGNLVTSQIAFNLTDTNQYTTITPLGLNVFKIDVSEPLVGGLTTLTGTASYSTASTNNTKVVPVLQYVPAMAVTSISIYADASCTIGATQFAADTSYYARINATYGNLTIEQVAFDLSDVSQYTTITHIADNVFKIDIGEPLNAGTVTLTGMASYSTALVNNTKDVPLLQYIPNMTISNIGVFTDAGCTVTATQFAADTSYYAKINATFGNLTIEQVAFTLTDPNIYTTISPVSNNIFKIDVAEPDIAYTLVLTGTASYSTASVNKTKNVPLLQYIPAIAVTSIDVFSDAGCTVAATQFAADSTYYAKVNATFGNLVIGQITFGLSDANPYTTISPVNGNVFKIDITEPLVAGSITLTGTASYSTASANNTKVVPLLQYVPTIAVTSIDTFSDAICSIPVSSFSADTTYYAKINATFGNLALGQISFGLSDGNIDTTITQVNCNVFKIVVAEPLVNSSTTLTGTASYSTASANNTKDVPLLQYVPSISLTSIGVYSDVDCTINATSFAADTSYYAKVNATYGNLNINQVTFDLSDINSYTTITHLGTNIFKIDVTEPLANDSVTLTGTASYSTASSTGTATITLAQYVPVISITGLDIYSDVDCTLNVAELAADTSYYTKIVTSHGNLTLGQLSHSLTADSSYATISLVSGNIFKIDITESATAGSVTFTGTASYSTASANSTVTKVLLQYIPAMAVTSIDIFSNAGCTVAATQFAADTTYYAKVNATFGNLTIGQIAFGLSDASTYTTISPVSGSIFKIDVTEPSSTGSITLTGTASYSTASANNTKVVPLLQYIPAISVVGIGVFSDVGCTTAVTEFAADTSYYAKVNATFGNLTLGQVTFNLSDNNSYTAISLVSNNVFKIDVAEPLVAGSITLTGTASYSTASANNTKVVPLLQYIPTIAVTSVGVFSDAGCTIGVSSFDADTTYYAKVNATYGNLTIGQVAFGLTSNSVYVTSTAVGNGVFSLAVTEPLTAGTVILTGTASYSTASANNTKSVTLSQYIPAMSVTSVSVFSDAGCTIGVTQFAADTTYYAKITATYGNLTIGQIAFSMTSNNVYVTPTPIGNGVFSLAVTEPSIVGSVALTGTVSYSTASANKIKSVTLLQYVPAIVVAGINIFSDASCTIAATEFAADTSYYAKVIATYGNLTIDQVTFDLTDANSYTTITHLTNNKFRIDVAEPLNAGTLVLTGTASYSTASANKTKNVPLLQYVPIITINGIATYSDAGCTISATSLAADTTYYAKISATFGNLAIGQVTFGISSNSTFVTPTSIGNGVFSLAVTEPSVAGSVILTGTASYSTASANNTLTVALPQYIPTIVVNSIDVFSDAGCTVGVTQFAADTSYYAKVNATYGNLSIGQVTFSLSDLNSYTTITPVSNNIFKIDVTEPSAAGSTTLTGTALYSSATANTTKVVPLLQYIPTIAVTSVNVYSDAGCTIGVSSLAADTTYYAKIAATYGNLTIGQVTFGMSSNSAFVTPTAVGNGVFSLAVTEPSVVGSVILTGTASYSTASANNTKTVTLPQYIPTLTIANITPYYDAAYSKVASVFSNNTSYYVKVVGTFGNLLLSNMTFGLTTTDIHCTIVDLQGTKGKGCFRIDVGVETSNDTLPLNATMSYSTATVNSSINIIVNKPFNNNVFVSIFNGSVVDFFQAVAVDTLNNIICVGYTTSEGAGLNDALIVKYDSNFNVLYKKVYGGTGDDYFYGVTTDSSNNIVAVGSTTSEGATGDALIVKFDPTLTILAKLHIGLSTTFYSTNYTANGTISNLPLTTDVTMLGKGGPRNTLNPSTNYTAGTTLNSLPLNTDITMIGKGAPRNTINPTPAYPSGTVQAITGLPLNTNINMVGYGGARTVAGSGTNYVFPGNYAGAAISTPFIYFWQSDGEDHYEYYTIGVAAAPQIWSLGSPGFTLYVVENQNLIGWMNSERAVNLYISGSQVIGDLYATLLENYVWQWVDQYLGYVVWNLTAQPYTTYNAGTPSYQKINGTWYTFPGQAADGTYVATTINANTGNDSTSSVQVAAGGNIQDSYTYYTAGVAATETINGATWTFPGQAVDGTWNETTLTKNTGSNASSTLTIPTGGNIQVSYTYYTAGTSAYETINGTQYTFPGQAVDGTWNATSITQNTVANVNSTLTIPTGGNIQVSYSISADKVDLFWGVTTDHAGNFIAVGTTTTEGSGLQDGLVIKFDTNLNILYKKVYGGAGGEQFTGVAVDSSNNVICVGLTTSEGAGGGDALVVKLDTSLGLLARKIYGGTTSDRFNCVAVDSLNNIICAGATDSEGSNTDAFVIKFDSNLAILYRKIYGGAGVDSFLGVTTDTSNNIICAGYTSSEGTGNEAFVIKFNSSLTIAGRKRYGGIGSDVFRDVVCDSSNNIICVGNSSVQGTQDGILLKSLSSLPAGSIVGTLITNMTLADSTLTLANSVSVLGTDTLALANSSMLVTTSTLILNTSTSSSLFDILY